VRSLEIGVGLLDLVLAGFIRVHGSSPRYGIVFGEDAAVAGATANRLPYNQSGMNDGRR
jgi:hypothetical protein